MRILICDDDDLFTKQLEELLLTFFNKKKIQPPDLQIYHTGEDLLADTGNMDLVFLDIEMPGMNGILTGQQLVRKNKNVIIIVTTSYAEYLDDAMRIHVFRYLSKPIERNRFYRNVQDALKLYHSLSTTVLLDTKEASISLSTASIVCVESSGKVVTLHTTDGSYHPRQPFSYWLSILTAPCFIQTHRSFLVNMKYISHFDHELIYLCGGSIRAYLAKRKYTEFKKNYLRYLECS